MSAVGSPPRDMVSVAIAFLPRMARAKWVGIGVLLLGLLGTAAWVFSTRRIYRSEAVVMYEPATANLPSSGGESPRQVAARLQDMVSSRQRLEGIIKQLDLYPGLVDRRGMVEAVEEMRARLKVSGREGYTFRVSFDIDSRERSQEVLAFLLKSIIDDDVKRRQKEADDARSFLDGERGRADEDLKDAETSLARFLAKHPELAGETTTTGGPQRANDRGAGSGGGELPGLLLQKAQIQDQIATAMKRPGPGPAGLPSLDPAIAAAQARAEADLHAAQADLADKQARYTNEHPDVKAAVSRLRQAEAAVRQAQNAARASQLAASRTASPVQIVDENPGSSPQVASLRQALASTEAQIAKVRARELPHTTGPRDEKSLVIVDTTFTQLSRAVAEARDRQQQIESKQFLAQLHSTMVAKNHDGGLVITDPPFKPLRPVSGGRSKVATAGVAVSLFVALIALVFAGLLDRRVYDAHDLMNAVHAEIVVVVPRLTGKGG